MFMKDGLHLVEMVEQSTMAWVVSTIFCYQTLLKLEARGVLRGASSRTRGHWYTKTS